MGMLEFRVDLEVGVQNYICFIVGVFDQDFIFWVQWSISYFQEFCFIFKEELFIWFRLGYGLVGFW